MWEQADARAAAQLPWAASRRIAEGGMRWAQTPAMRPDRVYTALRAMQSADDDHADAPHHGDSDGINDEGDDEPQQLRVMYRVRALASDDVRIEHCMQHACHAHPAAPRASHAHAHLSEFKPLHIHAHAHSSSVNLPRCSSHCEATRVYAKHHGLKIASKKSQSACPKPSTTARNNTAMGSLRRSTTGGRRSSWSPF